MLQKNKIGKLAGALGLGAVSLFLLLFILFAGVNSEFDPIHDFVSKLGAKGQVYALWWNLTGFLLVGLLFMCFGLTYGVAIKDGWIGRLLASFGLGFAFIAIPFDFRNPDKALSKAHFVAVCLGLAFWLFGLAKISYSASLPRRLRLRAEIAAFLLVLIILSSVLQLVSMPLTHRLIFTIVFGWTFISSVEVWLKD